MEAANRQKCQTSSKPFYAKLATKFLPSVFLFSAILSYPALVPVMFNFMVFCSSNINKNYMFLICNGILVLIAKNSGLISSSEQHSGIKKLKVDEVAEKKAEKKVSVQVGEEKSLVVAQEENEEENFSLVTREVEGQEGNEVEVVLADEDEDEDEDEEEEGEEAIGLLTAEELNKKCEEFIRRMKEGIKFEADHYQQQQLITVQC